MFCALQGQAIKSAFTEPLVLWFLLSSGDLDDQGKTFSLRACKVQIRVHVCFMRSRTILHKVRTPVISKRFVWTYTRAFKQLLCYSHEILKHPNRGSKVEEKHIDFKRNFIR